MINNNYNNNISFGVRYDLSDKANMFSFSQKHAIKKLVNKLGKYDVVCIGTQKFKDLINFEKGETFYRYGARIDSLVGGKQYSCRMYDRDFFSELDYLNPAHVNTKVKEKKFYKGCFDWIKKELQDLEQLKNENSSIKPSFFAQTVHDIKIGVRQWSRVRKTYNKDSIIEKIRDFYYKAKDC